MNAAGDRSHGGAKGLNRAFRSRHLWLAPAVVDGFDEADFDFLPADRRADLAGLVREFREIASTAEDGDAEHWAKAVEAGKPLLERIIEILEFDRYPDSDALRYGERIERAFRDRREIVGMKFRTGSDYAGTPTLWIDVTLSDDVWQDERRFLEVARPLDRELDRVAPELWPYISIRAAARRPAAPATV
ncbi:MAG: hypothetical protein BGO49_31090 [Planctomycetales bacterium 71-10]|nr:MAG: hypothetical protein BGO49_31090 [Planctomycetales bacterium 71-10]